MKTDFLCHRSFFLWKQILNKTQEIKNLKAENEALKQALAKETQEKVAKEDEFKTQVTDLLMIKELAVL